MFFEACSLPPFDFGGTTSSTSLTLGLEFTLLNELDFNKVPIHKKQFVHGINETLGYMIQNHYTQER